MNSRWLVAVFVAVVGGNAQATAYEWGSHPLDGKFQDVTVLPGSFADTFRFMVPVGYVLVTSTVVSNNLLPKFNIDPGAAYSLFSAGADTVVGGADDVLVGGAWSFSGATGNSPNSAPVGSGWYYYKTTGFVSGTKAGHYSITSDVSPIPEPETYAMLLAGLGALGFLARRRQNS